MVSMCSLSEYNQKEDMPASINKTNRDIPEEYFQKTLIESHRRLEEKVRKLSEYAKELETRNDSLRSKIESLEKELSGQIQKPSRESDRQQIKELKEAVRTAISHIEKQYPQRVHKLSAYKSCTKALFRYTHELQAKLHMHGIQFKAFKNTISEEDFEELNVCAVSTKNEINRLMSTIE